MPQKTAYIFPGQGTQYVGMGEELWRNSPAARRVFQEADDVLNRPLSRLIFEGPREELDKTTNAQPAILVVSLAYLKAVDEAVGLEALGPLAFSAGHSLGEYTALVASGAMSIADGVRLVQERGRLMQYASSLRPGGMAAILGLDEFTMEEIALETGVKIANVNSEDQIVISGDRLSLARAMDLATARGARKTIRLAVSGAFHSHLMAPAAEGLKQAVSQFSFRDPVVPVVANCTAQPLTTAQEVKQELIDQLCGCVNWKKSVRTMTDQGVTDFVEFGPGKVLTSLVKRISPETRATTASELAGALAK